MYSLKYSVFLITIFINLSFFPFLPIKGEFEIALFKSLISYTEVKNKYLSDNDLFIKLLKTIFSLVQYIQSKIGKGILSKSSFVFFFL